MILMILVVIVIIADANAWPGVKAMALDLID